MTIEVGDLVCFRYAWADQESIGLVLDDYMYNGHKWYKVQWNTGKVQDVAEVELKKIETDKN